MALDGVGWPTVGSHIWHKTAIGRVTSTASLTYATHEKKSPCHKKNGPAFLQANHHLGATGVQLGSMNG
jgi:hypothetical protein